MKKNLLAITVILIIASCSYVVSPTWREKARTDVSFSVLREHIDEYKGSIFILGGIIVSTKNTEEGSIIEAIEVPVDSFGNVIDTDKSSGRFLAIEKGYLDPAIYKKGREITVAGQLIGGRTKKLGEMDYTYPLFEIKELYLWREYRNNYYNYPPYYYQPYYVPYYYRYPYWWYDPFWYGPYYPFYP